MSDLLVDPEGTRRALHFLRHRGHELLVLHLLDPGERELPAAGDAVYFDPETGIWKRLVATGQPEPAPTGSHFDYLVYDSKNDVLVVNPVFRAALRFQR